MTERDYIKATNRVKVTAALHILREVLPGRGYGITEAKLDSMLKRLSDAEQKLFQSFELEGE
ncbi:MAG: hypothetical protein KAI25_16320 [Hyphomicrobiaceae bacterium]|nr:hypothetical protein [Hyphomicrobiaceae bacterium]